MKKVILMLCTILVCGVSASAASYNLCAFPFGTNGGFFLQYDGRFYDDSYAVQTSLPNGGIKFGFELGYYTGENAENERNSKAALLSSITFTKKNSDNTTNSTYSLATPLKYKYLNSYVADWTLTLGHPSNAIGEWLVEVVYSSNTYSAAFSITEDMLDALAPLPVELKIKRNKNDKSFNVCFDKTPFATDYRVRMLDGSDIVSDTKYAITPTTPVLPPHPICTSFPSTDVGRSGRVEARLVSGHWKALIRGVVDSACGNTWTIAKDSRACTTFTLED
jgi:hypothetical protein